jgi:hypothetical protein
MSSMEEYLRRLQEADERAKQRNKDIENEKNDYTNRFGFRK